MDCDEFKDHPLFLLNGDEDVFKNAGSSKKKAGKKGKVTKSQKAKGSDQTKFVEIKEAYKLKVTEVEVIVDTVEKMREFNKQAEFPKEFQSNYYGMMVILLKKAMTKAETGSVTLKKKKNLFKFKDFKQFLEFPNEYGEFKSDF